MKSTELCRAACEAIVVALLLAPLLRAEDKSLDAELMESLDAELLEGLETIPPDDAEKPRGDGAESAPGVATSDEDAFNRISKRMREAERLIPDIDSAGSTQKLHKEIVGDLEQLIAQLEQQCQKCQGGSSAGSKSQESASREAVKQPSKNPENGGHDARNPAKDSTEKPGKDEARRAALEKMKSLLKADIWGALPAKAREQMLQLSPEQFLPKYELLIEAYYKQLAERSSK